MSKKASDMTENPAAAAPAPPSAVRNDVADLPAVTQEVIGQMFVEGATCEDITERVNEPGGEGVSVPALENYFRTNIDLQVRRVEHMVQVVKELRGRFGEGDAAQEQALDAIIMTGLMGLRREKQIDALAAMNQRLHGEILKLRREKATIEKRKEERHWQEARSRIRVNLQRWKNVKAQTEKLLGVIKRVDRSRNLDSATFERIQEIYGLIQQPLYDGWKPEDPA